MRVERKLIETALEALKFSGLHPFYSKWYLAIPICGIIFRALIIFLTIFMMLLDPTNINVLLQGMETLFSFLQATKIIPALFFRSQLKTLISQIDCFWAVRENANDFSYLFKILRIYKSVVVLTLVIVILNSLMSNELVFACYVPDIPGALTTLMLIQYLLLCVDVLSVLGIDIMFIGFCIIIKEQMRILIIKMKEIEEVENRVKLVLFQKWVNHHGFIKDYIQKFEDIFTHVLFIQYMISIYSLCVELYQITESKEVPIIIAALTYIVSVCFEISLYCFSAEEITSMSVELSNAPYNIKWYNLPIHAQKNIQIMICCISKPIYLRALNMIVINRYALTMIFKTAISFYTLIQQVQEK